MNSKNANHLVQQVSKISNSFGQDVRAEKLRLIESLGTIQLTNIKQIKLIHDCLLFMMAYAEDIQVQQLAMLQMDRLCRRTQQLEAAKKEYFTNSGFAFNETQGTFSFVIIKWLLQNWPNHITIHSFDETGQHPRELLKHSLNEMEFELTGDEALSKIKWLEKASGSKDKKDILKFLITGFDNMHLDVAIKEQLFAALKLFISIQPDQAQFSKSFGRIPIKEHYFHKLGLMKKFDALTVINQKLPPEKKLDSHAKEEILTAARVALLLMNRETDPVSYGHPNDMKVFDLEHGLSIALFSIGTATRLPLDSYIGFMMFKNGYPMSYGGAWLFGKRALIGINIFEAFRGGESAFVFVQLLRTYKQAFGAEHFEVEPYQFGKNNPEGLQSGAFWFYHRFGFRPLDQSLLQLAEEEHQKIMLQKGYRSSIGALKQFTGSNLGVNFGKASFELSPATISHYISKNINGRFNANRQTAFNWSVEVLQKELHLNYTELNECEQAGFRKLSFFFALCLDLKKLNLKDKTTLVQLIKQKGCSEFEYINTYNKFDFEKHLVKDLMQSGG